MKAKKLTMGMGWWVSLTASSLSQTFVGGFVPDWNQPNWHGANGPNGGPAASVWDAWCVPTSAANVMGHWDDALGTPEVADGSAYPANTVSWSTGPSYQDYQANGFPNRGGHDSMLPGLPPAMKVIARTLLSGAVPG